jgi:hypothetical protein
MKIAFSTVRRFVKDVSGIEEIRFVVFSQQDYDTYHRLFKPDPAGTGATY